MHRRNHAVTLQQAADEAPMLAQLSALVQDSSARLRAIETLIPAALRTSVRAGPIDGTHWCILVKGSSAAAKLRQLQPTLEAHLRSKGWEVSAIRIKIQT
ncbi:hypothetical protein [Simplicispira suum]|uniref:DUF721 domain-containing protein n=1 Tax=Simplicispira suum TaxID=2109915 RepID=A0A2S0MXZ1_9BURK|nr:hypothetical protein [Simplicispira suum]AVO40563.1 hypothetical protein C6571_04035 [Simplicispira suum]MBW7832312.1 hypothetical protein [Simplicispira suum]